MACGDGNNAGDILPIERFGALCLRRLSIAVQTTDPAVASLLADLWSTLDADGGVGLAAPQIGRNLRVAVVKNPEGKPGRHRLELINPNIVDTFGPVVGFEEGCLSFPGLYVTVKRPEGVILEYQDRTGETLRLKDDGLLSRIVQHEVAHLDGLLFVDSLPWYRRWSLIPQLAMIRMGTFMHKRKTGKEAQ